MANNEMNVLKVGNSEFEIADAKARQDCSELKDDLTTVESDVTDLKDGLQAVETQIIATLITDTASGAIASFPDGADNVPVKSLTVDIEPVQDLHGYESPYPAGGSLNKLPPMVDGTYTGNGVTAVVKDGIATLSGTTTASGNALIIPFADTVTVPDAYMHLMNSVANGQVEPSFENSADVGGTSATFSFNPANRISQIPPSKVGKTWNRIRFYLASGVTLSGTIAPMAIADNTARSAYIPYSNICPISGHTQAVVTRTGVNVWDEEIRNGYYNSSGVFNSQSNTIASKNAIRVKPSTTYYIYSGSLYVSVFFYDINGDFITADGGYHKQNNTFTTPSTCYYIQWCTDFGSSSTYNNDISINYHATDTEYHAYNGQTVTIDLDGTRYGGTLNVETGVLTVDRAMVDLGTLSWTYQSANSRYYAILDGRRIESSDSAVPDMICTTYKCISINDFNNNGTDYAIRGNTSSNTIFIRDTRYTDATTLTDALSGVKLCYELAQPVTVQLTAQEVTTLKGQNNIWADCGDVTAEYRADTRLYIEKLTAPTEDDMIADHAISANTFFMVGNTLYRATTAIASGATITVGTNATKMSLSEALNTLS